MQDNGKNEERQLLRCHHVLRKNIFHSRPGNALRRPLGLQVFAKDCKSTGETAGG
jgi:hypothetical protein